MNKIIKKSLALLISVAIPFAGLVGCSKTHDTVTGNDNNSEKQFDKQNLKPIEHLRIGTNEFTTGFEATRTSNADAQYQYNIYESLIMRDPFSEELKYIPGLAESWKQIDPKTWEFKLRKNVKFHDGNVMTAEDVAFSLNRIFKKEGRDARFNNAYGRFFNTFDKVEIVDSNTVKISTLVPDPLVEVFLSDLSGAITSKAYVEKVGNDAADLKPVGTGPYKFMEFVPKEKAELERFEEYWGEKAPIKKVSYISIPEVASRVTAIANNEIDMAIGIPTDQEAVLNNQSGVKLIDTNYPLYHVMVMNMGNSYMGSHPKLRQALDLAVDREALNKALWNGKGKVPTSLQFPDYGKNMYLSDVKSVEYNPEKAKKLVQESGYDGTPIVITIRSNYYVNGDQACQAIIEMWKNVGVTAKLVQVPDVNKIPDDQIMVRTWSTPLYYPDPMGLIDASWSPNIWVSTRNFWKPQNPEWAKNFEIARFSTDVKDRKDAIRKLQDISKEEAGFILMYEPHEYIAVRDNISWKIPKNYRAYTISLRSGEVGGIEKNK